MSLVLSGTDDRCGWLVCDISVFLMMFSQRYFSLLSQLLGIQLQIQSCIFTLYQLIILSSLTQVFVQSCNLSQIQDCNTKCEPCLTINNNQSIYFYIPQLVCMCLFTLTLFSAWPVRLTHLYNIREVLLSVVSCKCAASCSVITTMLAVAATLSFS